MFETNVFGAAAVIDAFTPLLRASAAPVVVNVSSAVGSLTLNAAPNSQWTMFAYPMSKAALNMLTIQYARAFPRWRVNSARPVLTATEFTGPRDDAPTLEQLEAAGIRFNPVEQGAELIVRLALITPDGPTGTFVGNDGPLPWVTTLPQRRCSHFHSVFGNERPGRSVGGPHLRGSLASGERVKIISDIDRRTVSGRSDGQSSPGGRAA